MTALAPAPPDDALFPCLAPDQIERLSGYGAERTLASNERLFTEGEDESEFYIVLDGSLKVTKKIAGDEVVLTIHEPGEFTGALALLTGEKSTATAYAVGETLVRRIDADGFRRMLVEQPEIGRIILSTMALRRPNEDILLMQREKLAALGKLSAGLAHELNNPAAAAGRSVSALREALAALQARTVELVCLLPGAAWKRVEAAVAVAAPTDHAPPLGPMEQSDREETLGAWLEGHGVGEAYELAATLAEQGWTEETLTGIATDAGEALEAAVCWAVARLQCDSLMSETEHSVSRISELVAAIKAYSYQDQAPSQEVDVVQGLEATRVMLAHKLRKKNIEVVREYEADLPRLHAYGGELNQVWTNLLDNAIDAIPERGGRITITARREDDENLLVAVTDNGSGISAETLPHIFEPFFTTKAPGEGTGLGLDTTYRIVTQRHSGDLRVVSQPGETRFEVRLPLRPAV